MPARISPQLRFLLRGSGLFVVLLALWWWVLLNPMLLGLRYSAGAILWLLPGGRAAPGITVRPEGDWLVRVPVPQSLANSDSIQRAYGRVPGAPPVKVRSLQLLVADRIPTFFTLSFPLFWAIVLAAPGTKHLWRVFVTGTALLALLAVVCLFIYTAYTFVNNLKLISSPGAVALWNGVEYLNVNVAPYMAPLLIAVWLHDELRARIFTFSEFSQPAPALPVAPANPRRGRYRAR